MTRVPLAHVGIVRQLAQLILGCKCPILGNVAQTPLTFPNTLVGYLGCNHRPSLHLEAMWGDFTSRHRSSGWFPHFIIFPQQWHVLQTSFGPCGTHGCAICAFVWEISALLVVTAKPKLWCWPSLGWTQPTLLLLHSSRAENTSTYSSMKSFKNMDGPTF